MVESNQNRLERARGAEPVSYVRQIRNYRNILQAQLARKKGVHAG